MLRTQQDWFAERDDRCARCGGGELLRVILMPPRGQGFHSTPLCGQCATPEEAAYADTTAECPGCGIVMHYRRARRYFTFPGQPERPEPPAPRWIACSTRCYQRAWRAAHRTKTRTCGVCRLPFQTPRQDARFCSAPCRQRAYRRRLDALTAPSTPP